jgi:pimeloyl-ACP methyl ester carboxylesterase
VTVPTLVIVGERDLVTPKTGARALRDALPDARAVAIGGAGHVAMMERHQVWNELVREHLEQVFAGPKAGRKAASAR